MTPLSALLGFHARAGARLAMRTGVPAAALLTAAIGLGPGGTLQAVARDLASVSGSPAFALVLAVVAAGMAAWAAPRVCHGSTGWMRHLPADARAHRRSLIGALVVAQLPVVVAWVGLWMLAWSVGISVDPRRLVALPVVVVGVALAVLPSRWPGLLVVSGAATAILPLVAGWPGIAVASVLPFAVERFVVPPKRRSDRGILWRTRVGAGLLPALIDLRAIGARVLNAYWPTVIPLGIAWLFVRNNPSVAHDGPLRIATGLAVTFVAATLAEELARRRPPWRWARSLPWAASDRVRHDVGWLALHTVPILIVFGVVLDWIAALTAATIVPLVVVRAASCLRRPGRNAKSRARVVGEGAFAAAWLGVTPWAALVALMLVWPAWREVVQRDRNLNVSHWSPLDHLASGDPMSWRGS